ncbi:MAG: DUF1064 domain-containing protein [Clostridia bacterium]|nr:DUF1064 domain-containing protein [Clostridia bacterium]
MTHLVFDEQWLKDYEARTGLKVKDPGAPSPPRTEKRRNKYNARRTEYNGRVYDSAHEAETAQQMDFRLKAGDIRGWIPQVEFALPGGVKYRADFVVLRNDGRYDVVDAKSDATRKDKTYRIKRRQMKEVLGIEIVEV